MQKQCRCCHSILDEKPVLHYRDMPGMAQNFPDDTTLFKDQGCELNLYFCSSCGTLQLLDEPVPYYKDVIRASAVSEEMACFRLSYFKEFLERYHLEHKKVLEIGAGKGEFLEIMQKAGADAYGLEHNQESVSYCRDRGLEVQEGYLESPDQRLAHGPFDGFFVMNFLEHMPDPNGFLQGMCRNLKDGGIGLIEVPNADLILKQLMFSEFINDHLFYFTEDSLRLLLSKNGFQVLEIEPVWHDYCLAAVIQKRSPIDLTGFQDKKIRVTEEVNQFLDACGQAGKKVAIWGAGHQALALMALTNLRDKVAFVVDSAAFKQNKYTPGTHLKILSPECLQEQGIHAVIIMAASYSDEVARIMSEKYPGMEAVILRESGLEPCAERKDSEAGAQTMENGN